MTTVTVVNDSGVLDSGLSAFSIGILTSTYPAIPKFVAPDGSTATTKTSFNNSTALATTAYADTQARAEAGNYRTVTAITTTPYTVTDGASSGLYTCSAAASAITMPPIASSGVGDTFSFVNQLSTIITITADGASTFEGVVGSNTVLSLTPYSSVVIVKSTASTWAVTAFMGSAQQRVLASGNFTAVTSLAFVLSALDPAQSVTNTYRLEMIGFQPATTDKDLYLTVSSDGGSSYLAGAGYYGSCHVIDPTGSTYYLASSGLAFLGLQGNSTSTISLSSATNKTAELSLIIKDCNTGTSLFPKFRASGGYWSDTANRYMGTSFVGSNNAGAADFDAIKLTWESAANFAAVGSYVLYKTS